MDIHFRRQRQLFNLVFLLTVCLMPYAVRADMFDSLPIVSDSSGSLSATQTVDTELVGLHARPYLISVDQVGIDLHVELIMNDKTSQHVNSYTDRLGREYILASSQDTWPVKLRISAPDQMGLAGNYRIRVHAIEPDNKNVYQAFYFLTIAGTFGTHSSDQARQESIPHLERALEGFTKNENRYMQAMVHYRLGIMHYWLLSMNEAEQHFLNALDLFKELDDSDLMRATKLQLGATIMESQRFDEAKLMLNEVLQDSAELEEHYLEAEALNYLGLLNTYSGNPSGAISYFQEAYKRYKNQNNIAKYVTAIANTAWAYEEANDIEKAHAYYLEAIDQLPKTGNDNLRSVLMTNYANSERRLGNINAALSVLAEVAKIQEKRGDFAGLGWTYNGIAAIYRNLEDTVRAIEYQTKSVENKKDRDEGGGYSGALLKLGDDLYTLGIKNTDQSQLKRARDLHLEALEQAINPAQKSRSSLALSRDYVALNQTDLSYRSLQEALVYADIADTNIRTELLNTARIEFTNMSGPSDSEALAAVTKARDYFSDRPPSKRKARALHAFSRLATRPSDRKESIEYALQTLRDVRRKVANPWLSAHLSTTAYPIVEDHIDLLLHESNRQQRVIQALNAAHEFRGAALVAMLAESRNSLEERVSPQIHSLISGAYKSLAIANLHLSGAKENGDTEQIALASAKARQALDEIDMVRAKARTVEPAYSELAFPMSLSIDAIYEWLAQQSDETEIWYYFTGLNKSYGWRITSETVIWWEMPSEKILSTDVNRVVEQIKGRGNEESAKLWHSLKQMAKTVIPPEWVAHDAARVLIVPDGSLGRLPFSALLRDTPDGPKYLLELADIVFLPTLESLIDKNSQPSEHDGSALLVGAQDGDSHLLGAHKEIEHIQNILGFQRTEIFDASSAHPVAQLQKQANKKQILHFATHAWVDPITPALSGLELPGKTNNRVELLLAEVFRLKLDAELVFLSACDTNRGEQIRGEGTMGLTRGFLYAGAQQVISTNWPVSDSFSNIFSQLFYEQIDQFDESYSKALRVTQQKVLREFPEARHPYYWAGYTITGD